MTDEGRGAPPRHCMVVHAYYPLAETRVQREAEALVRAGYAVDVVCLRDTGERARERYRGVEIHRLNVQLDKRGLTRQFWSYVRFGMRAAARVAVLHHRHRYRSVQVHNLPDFLVFCALGPKLQRVPVILDLHDLMPEFVAGRFSGRRLMLGRLVRAQERLACRFSDHVITVSEHWRETLIARGVRPEKCSVVMNVADEQIFNPATARVPDASTFSLVYHGTVTRRYGLDLAVRAVARLREDIPGVHLTILGKGDAMRELAQLQEELHLEEQVELRDEYLGTDSLPALLAQADLGVVPYRNDIFTDGLLPTKLMEYAAMGLPCVAARTTAIDAYFHDTMVAFFRPGDEEDLADRVRELYRCPARREELARGSCNFVRRYNWEVVGKEYVDLVAGLGTGGARRTA
jgi:glycosyltransferase involved in cell wall biosynthesis